MPSTALTLPELLKAKTCRNILGLTGDKEKQSAEKGEGDEY
jgi:hypothetical protein